MKPRETSIRQCSCTCMVKLCIAPGLAFGGKGWGTRHKRWNLVSSSQCPNLPFRWTGWTYHFNTSTPPYAHALNRCNSEDKVVGSVLLAAAASSLGIVKWCSLAPVSQSIFLDQPATLARHKIQQSFKDPGSHVALPSLLRASPGIMATSDTYLQAHQASLPPTPTPMPDFQARDRNNT